MTAASYATNIGTILAEFASTSGWSSIGTGGAGLTAPETDYYIQGNNCITKAAWAGATKGMIYDSGSDQGGSGTDGAYVAWVTHTAPNSLAVTSSGGVQFIIGSSSSAYRHFYVEGSDTLTFQGWKWVAVSEGATADNTTGSPTAGVEQSFGFLWNLPSGGPTKGAPAAIDGIRFGRCDIVITNGTAPDAAASFDGVLSGLETAANRYGMLAQRNPGGAFENSGLIQFGTTGTQVRFIDSGKAIVLREHPHVTANFNTWEVNNASSVVEMTNISVTSLGTTSPGRFIVNNNATVTLAGCTFTGLNTFSFDTNTTCASTFTNCGQITHGGATMNDSTIQGYEGTANTSALLYNIAADPDGEMDGMTVEMGTTLTHGIEFGTSSPLTMTLRNVTMDGYSSTNNVNNSHFHVKRTAGTVTINLVGCNTDAGSFSYRTDGATVNLVIDPVTFSVNVKDTAGTNISGARVLAEVSATGAFPYQLPLDDLFQSGGTATATTESAHGLATNDYVVIRGGDSEPFNKVAQITVTGTLTFTYSVDSGASDPVSTLGSVTFAPISGTTDASGNISDSRTWSSSQAITGKVRKSTSSPYYKTATFAGTVNNLTGLSVNVQMISDE